MKITKYGLPQAALFPCIFLAAAVLAHLFVPGVFGIALESLLFIATIFTLSFFRDPIRRVARREDTLLSPCDGTVTEVTRDENGTRISVFLSLFSVHINRVPCSVEIRGVNYKKGEFRDARLPESSQINESNDVIMERRVPPLDTIVVRQVSGAVARHIVCAAKPGDSLEQGERFGMIKFGSRTDLTLRTEHEHEVLVRPGDSVRAGLTPFIKYSAIGES